MGASNEDRNGFSGSDRFMSITFYWRRFGGGAMVLLKVIFASNLQLQRVCDRLERRLEVDVADDGEPHERVEDDEHLCGEAAPGSA